MTSIADYFTAPLSAFYSQSAIHGAPKHTGRLPLSDNEEKMSVPKASLYAAEPYLVPERVAEQIQYRHSNTPLNTVFFSEDNMENLQGKIQQAVMEMSGAKRYKIDRQSDDDLKMIMRSYYLQYARNNPGEVAAELEDLNNRVIGFASNRIMVEIESYIRYRKDILDFPEPIERPVDVQIYGTRTGELKSFF
jgi:hypothetical protein